MRVCGNRKEAVLPPIKRKKKRRRKKKKKCASMHECPHEQAKVKALVAKSSIYCDSAKTLFMSMRTKARSYAMRGPLTPSRRALATNSTPSVRS